MRSAVVSPVRVTARLDSPLSRWLWLVKWLLVVPHLIVLTFLWITFGVLSVVAFVAIITGRYPRTLFESNLGVLRWTWRMAYYCYGALGTDRYPRSPSAPPPTIRPPWTSRTPSTSHEGWCWSSGCWRCRTT